MDSREKTDQALAVIKAHRALIRTLFSDPNDDQHWHFLLDQFADPENNRPIRELVVNADRTQRLDIYTGQWQTRTITNPQRGAPKPGKENIKAISTTLLPIDGRMRLYNHSNEAKSHDNVGILFDTGTETDPLLSIVKECFSQDSGTNTKFWIQGMPLNHYHNGVYPKAIRLAELREHNHKFSKTVKPSNRHHFERNEVRAKPRKRDIFAVAALKNTNRDRVNAIYRKFLIAEKLKDVQGEALRVPTLIIDDDGAKPYYPEDYPKDIFEGLLSNNPFAFAVFDKLALDIANPSPAIFQILDMLDFYLHFTKAGNHAYSAPVFNQFYAHYAHMCLPNLQVRLNQFQDYARSKNLLQVQLVQYSLLSKEMQKAWSATEAYAAAKRCLNFTKTHEYAAASVKTRMDWTNLVSDLDGANENYILSLRANPQKVKDYRVYPVGSSGRQAAKIKYEQALAEAKNEIKIQIVQKLKNLGWTQDPEKIYDGILSAIKNRSAIVFAFKANDVIGTDGLIETKAVNVHEVDFLKQASQRDGSYLASRVRWENSSLKLLSYESHQKLSANKGLRPRYASLRILNDESPPLPLPGYGKSFIVMKPTMQFNSLFVPKNVVSSGQETLAATFHTLELFLYQASDTTLDALAKMVAPKNASDKKALLNLTDTHAPQVYFPPVNLFDEHVIDTLYFDTSEYTPSQEERDLLRSRNILFGIANNAAFTLNEAVEIFKKYFEEDNLAEFKNTMAKSPAITKMMKENLIQLAVQNGSAKIYQYLKSWFYENKDSYIRKKTHWIEAYQLSESDFPTENEACGIVDEKHFLRFFNQYLQSPKLLVGKERWFFFFQAIIKFIANKDAATLKKLLDAFGKNPQNLSEFLSLRIVKTQAEEKSFDEIIKDAPKKSYPFKEAKSCAKISAGSFSDLKIGQELVCLDPYGEWYHASIKEIEKDQVLVTYHGFDKTQEYIKRSQLERIRLAPAPSSVFSLVSQSVYVTRANKTYGKGIVEAILEAKEVTEDLLKVVHEPGFLVKAYLEEAVQDVIKKQQDPIINFIVDACLIRFDRKTAESILWIFLFKKDYRRALAFIDQYPDMELDSPMMIAGLDYYVPMFIAFQAHDLALSIELIKKPIFLKNRIQHFNIGEDRSALVLAAQHFPALIPHLMMEGQSHEAKLARHKGFMAYVKRQTGINNHLSLDLVKGFLKYQPAFEKAEIEWVLKAFSKRADLFVLVKDYFNLLPLKEQGEVFYYLVSEAKMYDLVKSFARANPALAYQYQHNDEYPLQAYLNTLDALDQTQSNNPIDIEVFHALLLPSRLRKDALLLLASAKVGAEQTLPILLSNTQYSQKTLEQVIGHLRTHKIPIPEALAKAYLLSPEAIEEFYLFVILNQDNSKYIEIFFDKGLQINLKLALRALVATNFMAGSNYEAQLLAMLKDFNKEELDEILYQYLFCDLRTGAFLEDSVLLGRSGVRNELLAFLMKSLEPNLTLIKTLPGKAPLSLIELLAIYKFMFVATHPNLIPEKHYGKVLYWLVANKNYFMSNTFLDEISGLPDTHIDFTTGTSAVHCLLKEEKTDTDLLKKIMRKTDIQQANGDGNHALILAAQHTLHEEMLPLVLDGLSFSPEQMLETFYSYVLKIPRLSAALGLRLLKDGLASSSIRINSDCLGFFAQGEEKDSYQTYLMNLLKTNPIEQGILDQVFNHVLEKYDDIHDALFDAFVDKGANISSENLKNEILNDKDFPRLGKILSYPKKDISKEKCRLIQAFLLELITQNDSNTLQKTIDLLKTHQWQAAFVENIQSLLVAAVSQESFDLITVLISQYQQIAAANTLLPDPALQKVLEAWCIKLVKNHDLTALNQLIRISEFIPFNLRCPSAQFSVLEEALKDESLFLLLLKAKIDFSHKNAQGKFEIRAHIEKQAGTTIDEKWQAFLGIYRNDMSLAQLQAAYEAYYFEKEKQMGFPKANHPAVNSAFLMGHYEVALERMKGLSGALKQYQKVSQEFAHLYHRKDYETPQPSQSVSDRMTSFMKESDGLEADLLKVLQILLEIDLKDPKHEFLIWKIVLRLKDFLAAAKETLERSAQDRRYENDLLEKMSALLVCQHLLAKLDTKNPDNQELLHLRIECAKLWDVALSKFKNEEKKLSVGEMYAIEKTYHQNKWHWFGRKQMIIKQSEATKKALADLSSQQLSDADRYAKAASFVDTNTGTTLAKVLRKKLWVTTHKDIDASKKVYESGYKYRLRSWLKNAAIPTSQESLDAMQALRKARNHYDRYQIIMNFLVRHPEKQFAQVLKLLFPVDDRHLENTHNKKLKP